MKTLQQDDHFEAVSELRKHKLWTEFFFETMMITFPVESSFHAIQTKQ